MREIYEIYDRWSEAYNGYARWSPEDRADWLAAAAAAGIAADEAEAFYNGVLTDAEFSIADWETRFGDEYPGR